MCNFVFKTLLTTSLYAIKVNNLFENNQILENSEMQTFDTAAILKKFPQTYLHVRNI